ncbi:hypothetical protein [Streptomyces sp. NPDC002580]|uniref:hypothetical protein n=1 Tax=Streptomyces sp. NPDC002580 TaxID=3364653 RepID=UPI0036A14527
MGPAGLPLGARVRDGPRELRRLVLAHLPHPLPEPAAHLADALRAAAADLSEPT